MWLDLATMASEGGSAPLLVVAAAQPGEHSECSLVSAAIVSVARHSSSSPRRNQASIESAA